MKQSFWQRLKLADNKMAHGLLVGIGVGLAMGAGFHDWAMGITLGAGIGAALGAAWTEQEKTKWEKKDSDND